MKIKFASNSTQSLYFVTFIFIILHFHLFIENIIRICRKQSFEHDSHASMTQICAFSSEQRQCRIIIDACIHVVPRQREMIPGSFDLFFSLLVLSDKNLTGSQQPVLIVLYILPPDAGRASCVQKLSVVSLYM